MMAALTPAQIELSNSLTPAELPTKLRCAVCSKLAVNAFRLPCCETAICEKCQSTLPSACPVCEHSPVSASDCNIYKSLRTTIRVFLKTEEKKREAAKPKTNGSTPTTPAQDAPTPTATQTRTPAEQPSGDTVPAKQNAAEPQSADAVQPSVAAEPEEPTVTESKPDIDSHTKEDPPIDGQPQEQPAGDEGREVAISKEQDNQDGTTVEETQETEGDGDGKDQLAQSGMGSNIDSMNGNFMGFNNGGDMNQMQMMMAMQNGMNPAAFSAFPMMGMMDPMAMQNMMMNGGFGAQGMGMNGMNMNMGINGFNGGGNDWNGQQSWNVGQDNFNPNAPGMGNGDFGNFNAGFRTGFNSGNYGHHQFNDYRRGNNYGYRGRGRGRGFYGGYGRGYHHGYSNTNAGWAGQGAHFSGGRDGQPALDGSQPAGQISDDVDEFGRAIPSGPNQDVQQAGENGRDVVEDNHDSTAAEQTDKLALENPERISKEDGSQSTQGVPADDKGDVSSKDQHSAPQGPSRGSAGPMHIPTAVPDVPLNAPTGPKAMRQQLPNTSIHHLRARGLIADEKSPSSRTTNAPLVASSVEDKSKSRSSSLHSSRDKDRRVRERDREHDEDQKSRGRHRDRDRSRTHSLSKSQSRSRSRSRDRKESRKQRRHRSPSVSEGDRDSGHRHRKHKSRRQSTRDDDDYGGRSRDGKHDERSRSASPADREHKRSGHRSRRDRDEKRRERDVDRESDYDRHRKSGHRSHRGRDQDRERERDRDRDRERERDRDRTKDQGRDRDEDRAHRSGKSTNANTLPTPVEPADKTFNPPTGPRGTFSIKGASSKSTSSELEGKGAGSRPSNSNSRESESSRRPSQSSVAGQKPALGMSTKDPHTSEREARDRERLLKEAQRMATIVGRSTGVKRSREGGDDRGGRRKSRRSEAVTMDDEESRMRRLEAEREGRRWD
ncbi:hypothetical protein GGS26DRAFT_574072 [Hypomontagnella submonticulosa]|nr:hypothetical protein GGS26DRAFT_574072 [Hypomontagnella submonticulosa]